MDLTSSKILLGAGGASSTPSGYFIGEYVFNQGSKSCTPRGLDVRTVGQNVDNIYVIGKHSDNVVIVLKLDNSASPQWLRSYDAIGNNFWGYPQSIRVDPSNGDVYGSGYVSAVTGHGNDAYLFKYNDSGTLQWERRCHDSQSTLQYPHQTYNAIDLDSSGNIYVFGESDYSLQTTFYNQGLLTKYNSSGVRQWQRRLESSRGMSNTTGFTTSSGNCYMVGNYSDPTYGYHQLHITAKYNSSGVLQWQKRGVLQYSSTNRSMYTPYMSRDNSGNIYRGCGSSIYLHSYHSSACIYKEDSSGTIIWASVIGGSTGSTYIRTIHTDSQGNTYAAFDTNNIDANTAWCTLIAKWNSSGVLQWQRKFNAGLRAAPSDITLDSNNDIILSGWYSHASGQQQRIFVAKLPSDGSLTGTYGSWTYQPTSFSTASASMTLSTSGHTDGTSILLDSAFSYGSSNFVNYSFNTVPM